MALAFLAVVVSEWFFLAILVLMFVVSTLAWRMRCHVCGWPLTKRWWGYSLIAPSYCPKCGAKVT